MVSFSPCAATLDREIVGAAGRMTRTISCQRSDASVVSVVSVVGCCLSQSWLQTVGVRAGSLGRESIRKQLSVTNARCSCPHRTLPSAVTIASVFFLFRRVLENRGPEHAIVAYTGTGSCEFHRTILKEGRCEFPKRLVFVQVYPSNQTGSHYNF